MRRNDFQVQYDHTVATIDRRQRVAVDTFLVQRVFDRTRNSAPCLDPYVRQLTVDDGYVLIRRVNRIAYLKVQLDDTVATVEGAKRIVINTRYFDIALIRYIVLNIHPVLVELERIAVANRVFYNRLVNLAVEYRQVIIVVVEPVFYVLERVCIMQDSCIFRLVCRCLVVEFEMVVLVKVVVEDIRHILVRHLADRDGVVVAIYRIYEQMQRHHVLAVLLS